MSNRESSPWNELISSAHVWTVCPDTLGAAAIEDWLRHWLSADELAHHDELQTELLRRDYIAARALCRATLSHYTGVEPADWKFAARARGKPVIDRPAGLNSLRFNLTHTDGLVACVASRAGDVGIDAEEISKAIRNAAWARDYLSHAEQQSLDMLPAEQRTAWVVAQWVLKEAYLKGRGTGLSLAPQRFTVERDVEGTPLPLGDWQLTLHSPTPQHLAAVAVRRRSDSGPIEVSWFSGWSGSQ